MTNLVYYQAAQYPLTKTAQAFPRILPHRPRTPPASRSPSHLLTPPSLAMQPPRFTSTWQPPPNFPCQKTQVQRKKRAKNVSLSLIDMTIQPRGTRMKNRRKGRRVKGELLTPKTMSAVMLCEMMMHEEETVSLVQYEGYRAMNSASATRKTTQRSREKRENYLCNLTITIPATDHPVDLP